MQPVDDEQKFYSDRQLKYLCPTMGQYRESNIVTKYSIFLYSCLKNCKFKDLRMGTSRIIVICSMIYNNYVNCSVVRKFVQKF